MAFSVSGIGFYVYVGCNDDQAAKVQQEAPKPQPVALPEKKYHDIFFVTEKKDYSFGTSPNALRSYSTNGKGAPNWSPKL